GGAGNDVLTGGAGADRFLFERGAGRDVVTDFQPGVDKIVIGGGFTAFTSFAAVQAALRQDGADAVLELGNGDAAILRGVSAAALTATDFRLPAASLTTLRPTFADEFNSFSATPTGLTSAGTAGWRSTHLWGSRSVPNEVQYYADATTAGPYPFALHDAGGQGVLDITARPAAGLPDGLTYTSGLLTSSASLVQTYGYFEMRAQIATGKGFWPAFWLARADLTAPPEIDVLESLGDMPGVAYSTVHTNSTGSHTQLQSAFWTETDLSQAFHTYAVSWRPDVITFYIDGTELYQVATPSDMHSPMYMLANLAVGGPNSWPGATDGVSSATMSIDYIRASQFADLAAPVRPVEVRALVLEGSGAVERFVGGAGEDRITGGRNNDALTGGAGADTFIFVSGDGKDIITDFQPGVDHLLLNGVGANSVSTKASSSGLVVSYGKDTITLQGVAALKAGDILYGDATVLSSDQFLDRSASTRAQTVTGSVGNDTIKGGAGDDWIIGGAGNDALSGGSGRDTFVFSSWDGHDTINGFVSGEDHILLRGVPAASVWINPAHSPAGVTGLEVTYGTNGDSIFLPGLTALRAGDIVFA
ncbi:glycosyl hydrolase family protein, partial [Roseomonas nepalensis]